MLLQRAEVVTPGFDWATTCDNHAY